jgi:hypothetical protein
LEGFHCKQTFFLHRSFLNGLFYFLKNKVLYSICITHKTWYKCSWIFLFFKIFGRKWIVSNGNFILCKKHVLLLWHR